MYRICLRYCANEHTAADALQEAFIKVFQNIEQFSGKGNLGGWIRTIVVRCALAKLKQEKDFVELDNATEPMEPFEMGDVNDDYNYQRLLEHLKELPAGYKAVFNLYVFEELNHTEIAEKLGISEGTSRSQLYKARKMLQEKIKADNLLIERIAI
jgi:RNA polymerase sigma factor (sigma-70 family)